MCYGPSYEGRRRECDNCGHFTNVHSYCRTCDMNICEGCDHTCIEEDSEVEEAE